MKVIKCRSLPLLWWALFCFVMVSLAVGQNAGQEDSDEVSEETDEDTENSAEQANGVSTEDSLVAEESSASSEAVQDSSFVETEQSTKIEQGNAGSANQPFSSQDGMPLSRNQSGFERSQNDDFSRGSRPVHQRPIAPTIRAEIPRAPMIDRSVLQSIIMENNPVIAQARKTGKISEDTNILARFGLRNAQTNRFYQMSGSTRKALLSSDVKVVRRLLSMDGFGHEQGDAFYEYQPQTRSLILSLDDDVLVPLLNEGIEEDLLQESLTKMNLESSKPAKMPRFTPGSELDDRAKQMSLRLMESGNGDVFGELNELSDGSWDEDLLRVGEVADLLLRDYDLKNSSPRERLSVDEVLNNPFFADGSALYEELFMNGLVFGGGSVLGGRNLIIQGNAKALNPYFNDGSGEVLLVASKSLDIGGEIIWGTGAKKDARLVIMSTGELEVKPGAKLSTVTSDLVLATQRNLLLKQVSLSGASEVVIRGMRDVSLQDVSIRADVLATIKARRDLNVDGLTFNKDLSRIVMEATTMRLRNVNFPGLAQVRLNTLKGAVDGRYPNFGASIPAVEQIGRVNFIENVRSGGNLLHDRASFDLHGKNIEIGKIARP